ncbi:MAG: oligosaccharide flippase family protein [Gemmobacter sp.]|nr:oligosaccharide flippase family protein [Gemmobacter sp.]
MTNPFLRLAGSGLFARALRGSAIVAMGYVGGQAMRLVSNLVLTRLLFPEAFGLMALVTVVMIGLTMFSDVGIGPAILGDRRGDDPRFLDTAWTIQALRGGLLWGVTCALAFPLASFYRAPELAHLLPVAGLTLLIAGFNPTRIETANRHLALGRVTALDLLAQAAGIGAMIGLSIATHSVWALVWGNIIGALVKLGLTTAYLPGHRNGFGWDGAAAGGLIRFGGWIFLSTACGFLLMQGDKAILGRYLTLTSLGVYNIGYFLASFPMLLVAAVVGRIFIPVYREVAADGSAPARRRLRRMRFGMTALVFTLLAAMAVLGVALVGVLYDARYAAAGAVVVAIACVQLPQMVMATYDPAALAAGDSRRFFLVSALRAGAQTVLFLAGAELGGLPMALAGQALAAVLAAPGTIWLARRHKVHDPLHDTVFAAMSVALTVFVLWLHAPALATLRLL